MSTIHIHTITPIQPSNLNRDEVGNVKTVSVGGEDRARFSPQSRKAQMRRVFSELAVENLKGIRTTQIHSLIGNELEKLLPDLPSEEVETLAKSSIQNAFNSKKVATAEKSLNEAIESLNTLLSELSPNPENWTVAESKKVTQKEAAVKTKQDAATNTGALWFVTVPQVRAIAEIAASNFQQGKAVELTPAEINQALNSSVSLDQAAWGRMYANRGVDLNIDAAVQVAHSFSVNRFIPDSDFFTAMDELKGTAAVLDSTSLSSPIMYGYSSINVDALAENLQVNKDSEGFAEKLEILVRVLIEENPVGRSNNSGKAPLPSAVFVNVNGVGGSLAGAFLSPLDTDKEAAEALISRFDSYVKGYNRPPLAAAAWTLDTVNSDYTQNSVDNVIDVALSAVLSN